jgi:hypothetical protein
MASPTSRKVPEKWGTRPMNAYHIKCRPLEMRVGEPISTAGLTMRDMESVSVKVRKATEDLYYHA